MYARLVGDTWEVVPAIVRAAHVPGVVRGRLTVRRGRGVLARMLGVVLRFPAAGDAVPVRLEIAADGECLLWRRSFAEQTLVSRQEVRGDLLLESFGPFVCAFVVEATHAGIDYRQVRFGMRIGRWIAWLPRFLSSRVEGRLHAIGDAAARVRVTMSAPIAGMLLSYEGEIAVEGRA